MPTPDAAGLVPVNRERIVEDANQILHVLRRFLDGDKALCEVDAPTSFFAVLARPLHERLRMCLLDGDVNRLDASWSERLDLGGVWFHTSAVINGLDGGQPYGPDSDPCTLKECGEFIFDQLSNYLSSYSNYEDNDSEVDQFTKVVGDLKQTIVGLVESRNKLISLAGKLSPKSYSIVSYLWDRRSASKDRIYKDCWDEPVQPESAYKAIKRCREELYSLNERVFLDTKDDVVTLTRPDE